MIKLVLTDLDDTLIPFGAQSASVKAIEAFHAAQAAGVHVGPVTGRIPAAMNWMFDGHAECHMTGAFANGQVIHIDGERVCELSISRETLMLLADTLDELGDAYLTVFSLDDESDMALVTSEAERLRSYAPARLWRKVDCVLSTLETDYVKANILCARSREQMVELKDELTRRIPELDFIFPNLNAPIIDITPRGWTKGSAALYMADYLGIAHDEVAVFGDSENDLALIQTVPNSVAVANADPDVAASARWHIGASADDAVADAILEIAAATQAGEMPSFMQG